MMIILGAMLLAASTPDVQTLETAARPMMQSGELNGCELDFKTAFNDNIYRQGALSIVNGSFLVFGFNGTGNSIVVSLKTKIFDLTGNAPNWKQSISAPYAQWLMVDEYRTNHDAFINSTISEDGGRLSVFRFDDTFSVLFDKLLSKRSMTLTFNRHDGGSDVILPIDFITPATGGGSSTEMFGTCVMKGLDAFKKRLHK